MVEILSKNKRLKSQSKRLWWGKSPNKIEKSILKIEFLYIFDWNMFENSIFKTDISILLGLFPHRNLYRLTFQSFVLREYVSI